MKLKDIAPENRPRERLARCGPDVLSDAELLAIILKTGNREENAVDLANRLISKHGLGRLSSCSLSELSVTPGIGLAKACQILAVFELARRFSSSMLSSKPLESAKDVFEYLSIG